MSRQLQVVLCPQTYDGMDMCVEPCTRCQIGWDTATRACTLEMGVEHLPLVGSGEVPACPMAGQCQHQLQRPDPCPVRARGMVCESALRWAGDPNPENHPLAFHAMVVLSPEDMGASAIP